MGRRRSNRGDLFIANYKVRSEKEMVSLRDIWVAAGAHKGREPWRFIGQADTRAFIDKLAEKEKLPKSGLTREDDPTDLWAHWQIAMRYNYLIGHEWAIGANKAIQEWIQEKLNPEIKAERAYRGMVENYRARGFANPEREAEIAWNAIQSRHKFTDTVAAKVENPNYGRLTDIGYRGVFGLGTKELRAARDLPDGTNIRPFLRGADRAGMAFAEELTSEDLAGQPAVVTNQAACATHHRNSSMVGEVLNRHRLATTKAG